MVYLVVLLVASLLAILVAAGAVWWRLRRHLRHSHQAVNNLVEEIQPQEPVMQPEEKVVE
jgi:flagellar basal body-associated protein FliL